MPRIDTSTRDAAASKTFLERALSPFTDVRPGEGTTALLMLLNIFLLLVCYSVIKTVREPLILLGGGAEVRSYAAAGQALLLMGFVPLYSWFASRVDRTRLLVGVTLFFIVGIELFAAAVAARVPFVGVAFFIWVGIFNISLIAQFWSFANDIYSKDAGARLFPIIMIGMTAGAPLGSFVAGRLFHSGATPSVILQVAAVLLAASLGVYALINRRATRIAPVDPVPDSGNGFRLVLNNRYLLLVAMLVVVLNVVNTTGEYLVARLLTDHVEQLAHMNPAFDRQAYIGAFSGNYQFWVNVIALVLQALVTSRLVRHAGLRGALLALPLIALGGYAIVAAGVGFSVVRWIKTAENATDYSVMNTARQLLWLPTSREEKYKAKQAIDTFFVRGGDVLSAGVVLVGARIMHLDVQQFAAVNIVLTIIWLGIALRILAPGRVFPRLTPFRPLAGATAAIVMILAASPALAQSSREELLAAEKAQKASELRPYQPEAIERRLAAVDKAISGDSTFHPYLGSVYPGGSVAIGPGYRARIAGNSIIEAHAAFSPRNYRGAGATWTLPSFAADRVRVSLNARWVDAPDVAYYGTGNSSQKSNRTGFEYGSNAFGASATVRMAGPLSVGSAFESIRTESTPLDPNGPLTTISPDFGQSSAFVEFDWRTSPGYTRRGGLYRVEFSDFRQSNGSAFTFQRVDYDVRQFIPLRHESRVIALRALASTTSTRSGSEVPYAMLPDLGGGHALRGYSPWRFRDNNRLLLSGEYRWSAGSLLDMAAFVDAGKVAARPGDLDFDGLTTSYGLGVSVHTPLNTLVRLEVARARDGMSVGLSFGPSF